MSDLKVFVTGITGQMGQVLLNTKVPGIEIVGGTGKEKKEIGVPVYTGSEEPEIDFDIIIDFSSADVVNKWLSLAERRNKPVVIATTGLDETHFEKMKKVSEKVPVFYSRNMSIGIYVMKKIVGQAAKLLDDFDIEITETHHRKKVDAPSGTANMLLEEIQKERKADAVYSRKDHGRRTENEIGVFSLRGGTVSGDHNVFFFGEDEELLIGHRAGSRKIFATGAFRAAKFIADKKPGFYTMEDLADGEN